MTFYDISLPISGAIPEWPGSTVFSRKENKTSAITSEIKIGSHFGTHVDAPKHFLFKKNTVDKIALNSLIGSFKIFELNSKTIIRLADISKLKINANDRIIFKTRNSKFINNRSFRTDYVSLSLPAAQYLAEKKILLVGIDYYGIEAKGSAGHLVHKTLLKKNIVIVEGLNLRAVKSGSYQGAVLPLKIVGGDGAPARAVLWSK